MEEQDYRSKTLMVVVQRYFNRRLTSAPQGFDPVRIVSLAYGSVATAHGSNIPDEMVRFYAAVITTLRLSIIRLENTGICDILSIHIKGRMHYRLDDHTSRKR